MSRLTSIALACLTALGCAASSARPTPTDLGTNTSLAALEASLATPGPIEFETITSADWSIDRSGLINLDHPTARDAGLVDGLEPIEVMFHVVRHPTQGTFIVDTGVELALRDAPDKAAVRGMLASFMHPERLAFRAPLGAWLAAQPTPLAGVFLTHLHLDHVMGLPDVPEGTPVYTGPGETEASAFMHLLTRGTIDRALAGKPVRELQFSPSGDGAIRGVRDVFGDGSLFALWVPGHTPGSLAYVVRSTSGPVLLTGDVSHTRWGWQHDVEPGTFSEDAARSAVAFRALRAFARGTPTLDVRFGHQR